MYAIQAIDEHVDTRRKRRREEAHVEAMKKEREERPKISDQFADLKVRRRGVYQHVQDAHISFSYCSSSRYHATPSSWWFVCRSPVTPHPVH